MLIEFAQSLWIVALTAVVFILSRQNNRQHVTIWEQIDRIRRHVNKNNGHRPTGVRRAIK